jgi:hypothetical protein
MQNQNCNSLSGAGGLVEQRVVEQRVVRDTEMYNSGKPAPDA